MYAGKSEENMSECSGERFEEIQIPPGWVPRGKDQVQWCGMVYSMAREMNEQMKVNGSCMRSPTRIIGRREVKERLLCWRARNVRLVMNLVGFFWLKQR